MPSVPNAPRDFRPVTPTNVAALVKGALNGRHLYYDPDSLTHLPLFPCNAWTGQTMRYLDTTGHKARTYVEFKIDGHLFRRACTEEAVGNYGVMWIRVCGERYILAPRP